MLALGDNLGARRRSRVLAVVGNREISRARHLLWSIARKRRGAPLAAWQKRRLARLAPAVALRMKRRLRPVLSMDQAMELVQTTNV